MWIAYEPWIVALSILVAIQGSYVALGLTVRVAHAVGAGRRLLLAAAALTFAVSIWSMHFVGMLAMRLPFQIDYLVLPTLLSLLASVFVVGAAVFVASHAPRHAWAVPGAAAGMGVGIATMHYIGMMALHGSAVMHHDPWLVAASFAVAVAASALGLRFAFVPRQWLPNALAAVVFGVAISGMHYVAMAGLTLAPSDMHRDHEAAALSPDLLAVVVAVVAFAVSAVFLLTLVPDAPPVTPAHAAQIAPPPDAAPPPPQASPVPPPAPVPGPPSRPVLRMLPVERDGATHYLPVDAVAFVQADTHYTIVSDGAVRGFCMMSISEMEQLLDPAQFQRVHRSYIVAVARIASLRRSGDGGVARLNTPDAASVPVSRGRYPALKARIAAR